MFSAWMGPKLPIGAIVIIRNGNVNASSTGPIICLTVDHLASCKYAQTVGASSFGLYPPLFLFVVQLLVSVH